MNIEKIEGMSVSELESLAKYQHQCLYDNHPLDKATERAELTRVLESK